MHSCKSNPGFTLIEVLIAMTLLSIMVVLLFASMRISAESWQKGEDKITEVNDIAVVYQFFRNHLSNAKPLWDDFTDENDSFSFSGKSQELKFVSSFPASAKKVGLQQFSVNLINEDDEQLIQVSIIPFFPLADNDASWNKEEVILLRHVRNFTISYFTMDDSGTEGIWQEDWIDQDILPLLVKIQIETENGNYWPEMVFELKSEANPNEEDSTDLSEDEQVIDDVDTLDEQ